MNQTEENVLSLQILIHSYVQRQCSNKKNEPDKFVRLHTQLVLNPNTRIFINYICLFASNKQSTSPFFTPIATCFPAITDHSQIRMRLRIFLMNLNGFSGYFPSVRFSASVPISGRKKTITKRRRCICNGSEGILS